MVLALVEKDEQSSCHSDGKNHELGLNALEELGKGNVIGGDGVTNHKNSCNPLHNSNKNIRNTKGTETDRSCNNCSAKNGSRDGSGAREYESSNQGGGKEENVDETDLGDECCIVGNDGWNC